MLQYSWSGLREPLVAYRGRWISPNQALNSPAVSTGPIATGGPLEREVARKCQKIRAPSSGPITALDATLRSGFRHVDSLTHLPKANRPFDLLVFQFWSSFSKGPKRLTFYFLVFWASELRNQHVELSPPKRSDLFHLLGFQLFGSHFLERHLGPWPKKGSPFVISVFPLFESQQATIFSA